MVARWRQPRVMINHHVIAPDGLCIFSQSTRRAQPHRLRPAPGASRVNRPATNHIDQSAEACAPSPAIDFNNRQKPYPVSPSDPLKSERAVGSALFEHSNRDSTEFFVFIDKDAADGSRYFLHSFGNSNFLTYFQPRPGFALLRFLATAWLGPDPRYIQFRCYASSGP